MRVCISGGGLSGLALAIALSKSLDAPEIILIEKKDFTSRGATLGLALNGQRALEEICPELLAELKDISLVLPTGGYMLPWYRVRDGLLDHARKQEGVTILSETSISSIVDHEDSITVTFEQEQNGDRNEQPSCQERTVDLLIGADGVHSSIRAFIGAPPAVSSETKCWRGALNSLPEDLEHVYDLPIANLIKTGSGWFSFFNFNGSMKGFVSWVVTSKNLDHVTPLDTLDGIEDENDVKLARRLLEASTQQELEYSTIMSTIPMDNETGWGGKGRVTMIGDAAHALRPASGLGGSLALEDAAVLARQLVKNEMGETDDLEGAIREFEKIRFKRCKTIADDQERMAEASYAKDVKNHTPLKWTSQYEDWLFAGPDADVDPPENIYEIQEIEK